MDNNFYSNFEKKSNNGTGFFPRVFIPFLSGALGAALVLGVSYNAGFFENRIVNVNNDSLAVTTSATRKHKFYYRKSNIIKQLFRYCNLCCKQDTSFNCWN